VISRDSRPSWVRKGGIILKPSRMGPFVLVAPTCRTGTKRFSWDLDGDDFGPTSARFAPRIAADSLLLATVIAR